MVKTIRWIFRFFFLIAFVSVLAAGALFLWLRTSLPQTNGTMTLAGLSADVEVLRDQHGIPHIYAKTDADAFFCAGRCSCAGPTVANGNQPPNRRRQAF